MFVAAAAGGEACALPPHGSAAGSLPSVSHELGAVWTCHAYESGSVPAAPTEKPAAPARHAAALRGGELMEGGVQGTPKPQVSGWSLPPKSTTRSRAAS